VYGVWCTVCGIVYGGTVYSVQGMVYSVGCTGYGVQCIVAQCIVYSV
jgi:hypothetical protein